MCLRLNNVYTSEMSQFKYKLNSSHSSNNSEKYFLQYFTYNYLIRMNMHSGKFTEFVRLSSIRRKQLRHILIGTGVG